MNAQSPWPERDDTLRALWAQGLPTLAIAERMGLTKGQVVGRAHRLNLEARPSLVGGGNPKAAVIPLPEPREDGKVYTSFYNIRAWAGVYGIAYDGTNMDRVNKLRIAKSLPLLVQDET